MGKEACRKEASTGIKDVIFTDEMSVQLETHRRFACQKEDSRLSLSRFACQKEDSRLSLCQGIVDCHYFE